MCADTAIKQCLGCKLAKHLSEFSRDRSRLDGLDPYCRICTRERMRRKRARHLVAGACTECGSPRLDSASVRYCRPCAAFYSGRSTEDSRALRRRVLLAYGGPEPRCQCCGQLESRF